jgi:hypothetical protein
MVYAEDILPKGLKKKGVKKDMTNNKIIKQLEHKLDLFAEMMDVLEGGDCIEDMEDINTTDIETIMTLLSAFHDKTCGTINNVKWYETTFHNKS